MNSGGDCLIVGGGVIGLMTALDLAAEGASVTVVDRNALANEASWAGAGILSPAPDHQRCHSAFDHLRQVSHDRFQQLAPQLLEETGIDIELVNSGALEVACNEDDFASLKDSSNIWAKNGVVFEELDPSRIHQVEPHLDASTVVGGFRLPSASQVRNPRFLAALLTACEKRNVRLRPRLPVIDWEMQGDSIVSAVLPDGSTLSADRFIVTAGAWSARLLTGLSPVPSIFPVKGQILAFATEPGMVRSIVHVGKRYAVPRKDGLLLIGSNEVQGTFNKEVDSAVSGELREFAEQCFPFLRGVPAEGMWAGLRPGSEQIGPLIGQVAPFENLWVAAGHYRQGLQLSPGTSRLLTDSIVGRESFVPHEAFGLDAERCQFQSGFHS